MYTSRDFDPIEQVENVVYGLDFVNDLATGDSISSAIWYLTVSSGIDASPSSHLINAPWLESASITNQRISGLLPGVNYAVRAVVTTTLGDTLSLFSHILGEPVL